MNDFINKQIGNFVMWWCRNRLESMRKDDPQYTIFEIIGTGKDYPQYLIFTDKEHVSEIMKNI